MTNRQWLESLDDEDFIISTIELWTNFDTYAQMISWLQAERKEGEDD